jgi:hypothetical protein
MDTPIDAHVQGYCSFIIPFSVLNTETHVEKVKYVYIVTDFQKGKITGRLLTASAQ